MDTDKQIKKRFVTGFMTATEKISMGICENPRQRSFLKNGFTLIELTIVIFLMLLILAIVAVNFASTLSSNKLNTTAREISSALRNAKASTYFKGETQTVEFDLEERKYGLTGRGSKELPEGMKIQVVDPLLGEIDKGKWQVVFSPEGSVSGGTIILSSGDRTVHLKVDPIVGSVKIAEGQKP